MASTLIIYAHPGGKGHNAEVRKRAERWLKKNKEDYEVIDLYKEGYNPVLLEQEARSRGKAVSGPDAKRYQELVKEADRLIFIYPVWWGSMPAILKGFFDRVFAAKFAFKYEKLPFSILGMKARPVGLLKGKRALVFLTMGSTRWAHLLILRSTYRFSIKRLVLGFSGIKTKVRTIGGCGDPIGKEKRSEIARVVNRGMDRFYG